MSGPAGSLPAVQKLRIVLPTVFVAGVLALAGCSSSSSGTGTPAGGSNGSSSASPSASPKPSDATSFVTNAFDAFSAAESVHVAGTFAGAGDNGEALDIDINYGKDVAIGTLTVSGQKVEISKAADGKSYLKGDAAFYKSVGAPDSAIAKIAGKYVEVTASTEGFSDFVKLLDKTSFAEELKPDSTLTSEKVTGPTTVNGVSCYGIEDTDGAFYAAAAGDPLPVQLKSKGDGQIDFDKYGDPVNVPTPAAADVVQIPAS